MIEYPCDICGRVFSYINDVVKHREEDGCEVKVIADLRSLVRKMVEGLDKIARLGSEPLYGNSIGNIMAQEILSRPEVKAIMEGK